MAGPSIIARCLASTGHFVSHYLGAGFMAVLITVFVVGVAGTAFVGSAIVVTPGSVSIAGRVIMGIISGYFLIVTLVNYFAAVFTRNVSPKSVEEYCELGVRASHEDPLLGWTAEPCPKCGHARTPRVHHCSWTGRCVFRYDHYCPWVGLIAADNYPYFVGFLFTATIGSLASSLICIARVWGAGLALTAADARKVAAELTNGSRLMLNMLYIISLLGLLWSLAAGFMALFHLQLLGRNRTTTETYDFGEAANFARRHGIGWANPYDLGFKQNVRQVFGPRGMLFCVFLPGLCRARPLTGAAAAAWPIRPLPPVLPHVPASQRDDVTVMAEARAEAQRVYELAMAAPAAEEKELPKKRMHLFSEKPLVGMEGTGVICVAAHVGGRFSGAYFSSIEALRAANLIG